VPDILEKQVRCPTCKTIISCTGSPGEIVRITCPSCGFLGKVTFPQAYNNSKKVIEIQHLTKTFGKFTAVQFIPLIIFPSILLAGLFWPIESIPSYLQPLSYIIPLRYGIDAERSIMLRGWGIGEIWVDILVLVLFALLTLSASVLLLKRKN